MRTRFELWFGKMLLPMAVRSMKGGMASGGRIRDGRHSFGRKRVCLRDKLQRNIILIF